MNGAFLSLVTADIRQNVLPENKMLSHSEEGK